MLVLISLIIFAISLIPSLVSLLMMRKLEQRWQNQLRLARSRVAERHLLSLDSNSDNSRESRFIGNINCRYNARSPYLRCAVNPSGECAHCLCFEAAEN